MRDFLVEATLPKRGVRYCALTNIDADDTTEAGQRLLNALNSGDFKWLSMSPNSDLDPAAARLVNLAHVVSLKVLEEIDV